jgi:hypothetical protein
MLPLVIPAGDLVRPGGFDAAPHRRYRSKSTRTLAHRIWVDGSPAWTRGQVTLVLTSLVKTN